MSTLTGNKISLTYKSLIKTSDNEPLSGALKQLSDGLGNNSGVYLNTGGDLKSTGTLEFANFKGTSTAVTINKLVNEADGISNNDNDTSLPTSAAVKNYVDTNVTSQDLDFVGDNGTPGAVDLDSESLNVLGTTNEIVTSSTGFTLTIGLPDDVTISGTYTGATFSGDLNGTINTATTAVTQTAGNNSTKVATTAYVDTLDAASDLDFSGNTGTGDVNLNTQSLAVTGTTNQITTAASNQGLEISLLSTGVTMPDGSVATTQTAGDNSTKLATTAYVDVLDSASDLDITDGTNASDVNLNTQSLSILGTANEIVSTVSAQTATISLPSTIVVNVTGNVTGDLTGNADTATKWETARDLSLTSEATGTISSVDGTNNVSGAVTLLNSAVVAKVLTGLPTPAAGNIEPSDTILEAFGKVQSQINSISSGLIFKGSWDAATNTPTLTSGGGEVDAGTTDGATTAFKLIDSSQNFNTTVSVGNKVINQVDGQTALVTVIDSNTQLTLDKDIMLTAEAYTIDASPFIQQGQYYVVNFAGTTNLNGINNWSIGDWVIADANNEWSKLDHSQIDGQGTTGNLPVFTTANTIGDSIVSESGTALTITGSATTTLGFSSTGDFAVNTDKFTVNATSGNISVGGTGTFAGQVKVDSTNPIFLLNESDQTANNRLWGLQGQQTLLKIRAYSDDLSSAVDVLTFARDGNSTFAGNVVIDDGVGRITIESVSGENRIQSTTTGFGAYEKLAFTADDYEFKLGNSTFAGSVTANTGSKITSSSADTTFSIETTSGTTIFPILDFVSSHSTAGARIRVSGTDVISIDKSQNSTFAGSTQAQKVTSTKGFFATGNIDAPASGTSALIMDYYLGNSRFWSRGADATTKGGFQFIQLENDGGGQTTPLTIDSSGRVGIGIDPFAWDSSFNNIQIGNKISLWNASNNGGLSYNQYYNGTNNIYQTTGTANRFQMDADGFHFYQAASGTAGTSATFSESMTINSSGNVDIKTGYLSLDSKANNSASVAGEYRLALGHDASTDASWIQSNGVSGTQRKLLLNPLGGNVGIGTIPSKELDVEGNIRAKITDGSTAAQIDILSGSTWRLRSNPTSGTNDYGLDIIKGSAGTDVKMSITSGGEVLLGKQTTAFNTIGITLLPNGEITAVRSSGQTMALNRRGSDGEIVKFYKSDTQVGNISVTALATSYNTNSDYRLKEDLQDFNGLDKVSKIPVYDFKWKSDESRSYGVMAHELQEVLPQAVVGKKDAEEMQGVDYSKIVPLLVKSIQELKAEVDKLKQECKCK